jgi:5-methylcytosine-specific restriction endonuclease McrA
MTSDEKAAELLRLDALAQMYLESVRYCYWCEREITEETGLHLDHVIPRCEGGGSHSDNLVPSCMRCNLSKGGRLPWVWLPDRPDLWEPYRDRWDQREEPPLVWHTIADL